MTAIAPTPDLIVAADAGVVRLTLNRPARRNALSLSLLQQLESAFADLDASARVVVLAAEGNVFCSGHDLGEMVGREEAEYRDLFETCSRVMLAIRKLPVPVIARVQGHATAAGCQLVAACDLAVTVDSATFATPGVKIGLFCSTPMVPLVRAVPAKAAMEMLLTGVPVSATQALAWGLVNRVVPATELDAAVEAFVAPILASSPLTVAIGKEAFYRLKDMPEEDAYAGACDVMTSNALRADAQEGMTAFLKKRPPVWTGE